MIVIYLSSLKPDEPFTFSLQKCDNFKLFMWTITSWYVYLYEIYDLYVYDCLLWMHLIFAEYTCAHKSTHPHTQTHSKHGMS